MGLSGAGRGCSGVSLQTIILRSETPSNHQIPCVQPLDCVTSQSDGDKVLLFIVFWLYYRAGSSFPVLKGRCPAQFVDFFLLCHTWFNSRTRSDELCYMFCVSLKLNFRAREYKIHPHKRQWSNRHSSWGQQSFLIIPPRYFLVFSKTAKIALNLKLRGPLGGGSSECVSQCQCLMLYFPPVKWGAKLEPHIVWSILRRAPIWAGVRRECGKAHFSRRSHSEESSAIEIYGHCGSLTLASCFFMLYRCLISDVTASLNQRSKWESREPCAYFSTFTQNLLLCFSKIPSLPSMYIYPSLNAGLPTQNQTFGYAMLVFCVFDFLACAVSSMFGKAELSTFDCSRISRLGLQGLKSWERLTGPCSLGLILQALGRQSYSSKSL